MHLDSADGNVDSTALQHWENKCQKKLGGGGGGLPEFCFRHQQSFLPSFFDSLSTTARVLGAHRFAYALLGLVHLATRLVCFSDLLMQCSIHST